MVCERHGIAPSVFYEWQRKLFDNGASLTPIPFIERSRRGEADPRAEIGALSVGAAAIARIERQAERGQVATGVPSRGVWRAWLMW